MTDVFMVKGVLPGVIPNIGIPPGPLLDIPVTGDMMEGMFWVRTVDE